jgi:RimJ/RimL family protein N-acetyltransferase
MTAVQIRRLSPDDWAAYREIRLAALADSPEAFGSTLAREQQFTEAIWRSRLTTAAAFGAERHGDRCLLGIAAGLPTGITGSAILVSMWIAPEARRQGIGEALVHQVIAWAKAGGFSRLELEVTAGNTGAERLYERCGFARTGENVSVNGEREHRTVVMVREI